MINFVNTQRQKTKIKIIKTITNLASSNQEVKTTDVVNKQYFLTIKKGNNIIKLIKNHIFIK